MKTLATKLIDLYQKTLSPDHGPNHRATCRFIPTCSEYGKEAINKYGFKGILMTSWRVFRCNPLFTKAGTIDQVR